MKKPKQIGYLHVAGQYTYHDHVQITGTRLGLEALAKAVAHALKYKESQSDAVFASDGEGYTILVKRMDDMVETDPPYIFQQCAREYTQWQDRAFSAEIECSRLKKAVTA